MAPRRCLLIFFITIYAPECAQAIDLVRKEQAAVESPLSLGDISTSHAFAGEILHLLQKASESPSPQPAQQADSTQRLHIISVVGVDQVDNAKLVQSVIKRSLGPNDAVSHVCGPACARKAGGSLEDLNIMPEPSLPSSISGYKIASAVKFPYALIHLVQKEYNRTKGGPNMAQWFLLKDYDTYVNAEGLMAQVSTYDSMKPYAFASYDHGCPGICGGAGLLFSRALAEELAFTSAHKWQSMMMATLFEGAGSQGFYWDVHIPEIVKWVEEAQLINLPSMTPYGPMDGQCVKAPEKGDKCFKVPECNCALSSSPATYHVKYQLEDAVKFFMN